jgi:hypothetical protein
VEYQKQYIKLCTNNPDVNKYIPKWYQFPLWKATMLSLGNPDSNCPKVLFKMVLFTMINKNLTSLLLQ